MNSNSWKKLSFTNKISNMLKGGESLSALGKSSRLDELHHMYFASIIGLLLSSAILMFIVWAAMTKVSEVTRADGEIVPHGFLQVVQHLDGGMVKNILVKEGDIVEADQVLLHVTHAGLREDLEKAVVKIHALAIKEERLKAFLESRDPNFTEFNFASQSILDEHKAKHESKKNALVSELAVIDDKIKQREQELSSLENDIEVNKKNMQIGSEIVTIRERLSADGHESKLAVLNERRQFNELSGKNVQIEKSIKKLQSTINELKAQKTALSAGSLEEAYAELDEVQQELAETKAQASKFEQALARQLVRSPTHGIVKSIQVNTIGEVIQPAETLIEIVPLDKQLVADIHISPGDIGHVKVGQDVMVKISSFDFLRYGVVAGKLEHISATTFSDKDGQLYYRGRVVLAKAYVGDEVEQNKILPGMQLQADIITGNKSVLDYMLRPIQLSAKTAFTER